MDDRLQVELFRREEGKIVAQTEPRLGAEDGQCAHPRAIAPRPALFEDEAKKIVILTHEIKLVVSGRRADILRSGGSVAPRSGIASSS